VDPRPSDALVLLGASGFLGAHLVRAAAAAWPGPVLAVARRPPLALVRGPATTRAGHRLQWREADLVAPGALEALVSAVRPRAVVLAAAMARMGDCEGASAEAAQVNAELPARAAALARALGLRLVHVSTDLVFGDGAEERVLAADAAALVVRLPLLLGDSFGRGLGASDQLLVALERGERPRLFADELRTPLAAADAAAALIELAGAGGEAVTRERGILHVAGPVALDRYTLGRLVAGAQGVDPDRLERSRRAAAGLEELRPADVRLDASRARGLLRTRLRAPAEALVARGRA